MVQQERMAILKMIEEGKITAEEGMELMEALGKTPAEQGAASGNVTPAATAENRGTDMRMLRIRVTEGNGKTKVNVNLPIQLVKVGLDIAKSIKVGDHQELLQQIDMDEILRLIAEGAHGKLVEIESPEDQTYVEVFVE